MQHTVSFAVFLLILFVVQMFLPWWCGFSAAFVWFYLWTDKRFSPFLYAFIVGFVVWLSAALFRELTAPQSISAMLSSLLGQIPVFLVFIITGLVGGFTIGLGGWLGRQARILVEKKEVA